MRIIRSTIFNEIENKELFTLAVVIDSGDIFHIFCLSDGVHWSHSAEYRGRYEQAVEQEMRRTNATIVAINEVMHS